MKWWEQLVEHFKQGYDEEDLELEWEASSIENWDWNTLMNDRSLLKMKDEYQRKKYVCGCVEQYRDASGELERLSEEYNMVTAYLKDIEEIEALPETEANTVRDLARKIHVVEKARKEYREKKDRLTDSQFQNMEQFEDIMPAPYRDIKEAEDYRRLIKDDLSRLEGEKHAYQYRRGELYQEIANIKGMLAICAMAFLVCIFMLMVLQFGFAMETQMGYLITVAAAAIAATVLYVRYLDDVTQLTKTERGINKIILLKNTVNIRYVNNTNLLDYLYMKYKVNSGKEMLKIWEKYQIEKEERNKDVQNSEELEYYKRALITNLRRFRLYDPNIWMYQAEALWDKKEMVEIRHGWNERRQKLRIQMEYNKRLAAEAGKEIKSVISDYPQYTGEVLECVERLGGEYGKEFIAGLR